MLRVINWLVVCVFLRPEVLLALYISTIRSDMRAIIAGVIVSISTVVDIRSRDVSIFTFINSVIFMLFHLLNYTLLYLFDFGDHLKKIRYPILIADLWKERRLYSVLLHKIYL